jgi:TolA-binding protein
MKRSERQHLKENELAASVAVMREQFDRYRKPIIAGAVAIVVVAVVVGGYMWWKHRSDNASRAMLAEAIAVQEAPVTPPTPPPAEGQTTPASTPVPEPGSFPNEQAKLNAALPMFVAVADKYPSTSAGIAARYQAAACLVELGRPKEAIERYQEVIERDPDGIYGDMARFGLGEAHMQAGQYDAAIAEFRELSNKTTVPRDAALMQLGRAYAKAGKKAEAEQTFKKIMDEFPQSQYAQVAKREIDLQKAPGA